LFPSGDWPEHTINLYLIVAETLLLEAVWQKQQVHPEAFAKSIQPIFHSQGAFQDVNCAWESISKPTVKSEREYMLLSELWLQGLYYQDDAYHQQIWHHFEGLLADDLIQEYRLMSALFFLRH